jgi:hypothetical protein
MVLRIGSVPGAHNAWTITTSRSPNTLDQQETSSVKGGKAE